MADPLTTEQEIALVLTEIDLVFSYTPIPYSASKIEIFYATKKARKFDPRATKGTYKTGIKLENWLIYFEQIGKLKVRLA